MKTRDLTVWVLALGAASCNGGSSGQEAVLPDQTANAGTSGAASGGSSGASNSTTTTPAGGSAGAAAAAGTGGGSAGGSGGGVADCTLASSWHLVDDYTFAAAVPTGLSSLASDSSGALVAVGSSQDNTGQVGLVRRSASGGSNWTNMAWTKANLPNSVAADDAGHVFIAASTGGFTGAIFRSSNGSAFESVYPLPNAQGQPSESCKPGTVATGANGVVVAGVSCYSTGWVVAQSRDHGSSWQIAFTFQLTPDKTSSLHDVGVGPDGTPYATGFALGADDEVHWLTVRPDPNAGSTSAGISDDFQLSDLPAQGLAFASNDASLVVGFANDDQGRHGIARRRNDDGTWDTIDTFGTQATAVETVGNQLFITGQVGATTFSLVTRRSDDQGSHWTSMGEWQYLAGKETVPVALARDARGNLFAGANGRDVNDRVHWLVRKLDCE